MDGRSNESALGIIVPLYNEALRFARFAPELADFIMSWPKGSELIFVDDGSTDDTSELAEKFVVNHPEVPALVVNRPHLGKGAAIAAGMEAATADYLGFCDIDLSTPLEDFKRVVHTAMRGEVLAIGSRDLAGSNITRHQGWLRETAGRAYNRVVQAALTPGIVDTQCGAKAASKVIWQFLLAQSRETGFAWDAEVIAIAMRAGVPVQEVPIEWHHEDDSRLRFLRDGVAMVIALLRIWMNVRNISPSRTGGGVFEGSTADLLMDTDSEHWWYRSKAAIVADCLRYWCGSTGSHSWLVDVGAGSGGVTSRIGWDTERVLVAEGAPVLAAQARDRHGLMAVAANGSHLPLAPGSADVMCLLDVIEHIADSSETLSEAWRVLAPGGHLIVTVPGHQWLWSEADEFLGHTKRYSRTQLAGEVERAGFSPLQVTHFFSWLVPPVLAVRRFAKTVRHQLGLERSGRALDVIAMVLTRIERALMRRMSLPLGTSVLCVARKPEKP